MSDQIRENVVIKLKELQQTFNDYKSLLTDPELYAWSFFDSLRNQIDIEVNNKLTKLKSLDKERCQPIINESWQTVIERVNEFEKECKFNLTTNKSISNLTREELGEHFKQKEQILACLSEKVAKLNPEKYGPVILKEIQANIDNIYLNGVAKKEKVLFMNKTIFFLPWKENEIFVNMDPQTSFGKLVLVRNQHVDQLSIETTFEK